MSSRYREQPTLDLIIKGLKEQLRDLATQSRLALTTQVLTATQRLVVSGSFVINQVSLGPDESAHVAIDASLYSRVLIDLTFDNVNASIVNPTDGQELSITWGQPALGGQTYVWPPNCKFAGSSAPNNTTPASWTTVTFIYRDPDWYEISRAVGVV